MGQKGCAKLSVSRSGFQGFSDTAPGSKANHSGEN
jgi:hypothetical protein